MKLSIEPDIPPLTTNQRGVVRIGKTRVPFDTVVYAFNHGAKAEEISERHPSLQLADIYSVIGYYLRHPSEVDAYLKDREALRVRFDGKTNPNFQVLAYVSD